MTSLLINIKHRFPGLWLLVERVNGWLFGLLYPGLSAKASDILGSHNTDGFCFSLLERDDIPALSRFLTGLPAGYLACFNPHPFDEKSLERLFANKAFLMMKITAAKAEDSIVGYFFLRCFFVGKAFHGLLVDKEYSGCGLGTTMWALSMRICHAAGLRMFATISVGNTASLRSVAKATHVELVENLDNDYQLVECKLK